MPAAFRPEENSLCFGRTIKSSLGFAHPSSNMWSASNILLQQIQENHITLSVFSPPCREGCGCESGAWWRKIDYPDKGTTRRARLQYVLRFVTNSKIIWQNAKQREQPGIREIKSGKCFNQREKRKSWEGNDWKEKMILILMMRRRQKMNAPISRFNKRLSRGRGGGILRVLICKKGKRSNFAKSDITFNNPFSQIHIIFILLHCLWCHLLKSLHI